LNDFFKARYDASHRSGVEKLQNGTIPLFPGVSEVLRNDMIVAVKLKNCGGVVRELLRYLNRFEGMGFSFFMAGREFPLHVTIQVATGGHEAQSELESGVDYVDSHLLTFNRLVLDGGGNIVLMNEGVPAAVSEWRGWASQVMIEHGGVPKPLSIFHATMARTKSFDYSIEAAMKLVAWVEDWNAVLQEQPAMFVSQGTFVGTTYDLLTT